jgi:hypothetical protein
LGRRRGTGRAGVLEHEEVGGLYVEIRIAPGVRVRQADDGQAPIDGVRCLPWSR